jgi:peptidoglycan/LPS O-acetylase OafA/YrhL
MPPVPATRPGARRIDELEGLRGLLALWVAVSHIACLCGLDELRPHLLRRGIWDWLLYAGPAVDVFIILSGFAIFKMLQREPMGYRAFLTGRAFRLFPVYLVCLALAVMAFPLSQCVSVATAWHLTDYFHRWSSGLSALNEHWSVQLGLQLSLLHGLLPPGWPPPQGAVNFLPPAWSATLEWQFYLVAPAMVACCAGARRRGALGGLLILAFGVAFISEAAGLVEGSFLGVKLWLFVLGMISAQLHERLPFLATAWQRWWWLPAFALAAALTFVFHTPSVLLWLMTFGIVLSIGKRAAGLRQLLTSRPLLWLGSISYSLYLLHWPLLVAGLALILHFSPAITGPAAAAWLLAAGLPVVLVLAGRLHVWLEAPLMRLGRRLSGR